MSERMRTIAATKERLNVADAKDKMARVHVSVQGAISNYRDVIAPLLKDRKTKRAPQ